VKILYVAMKHDYGKPEQGYSFEHFNFYDSLVRMGHDIVYFDFYELAKQHGRDWMNRRLREVVDEEEPDLLFAVMFQDELDPAVIASISNDTPTTTLNWFCDDHWRFESFSGRWAHNFNWVVTTALDAVPKYAGIGYANAIKSQWGCNHFLYRKLEVPTSVDISFVGQPHGNRREVIGSLRERGLDVQAWGSGWEAGRLSQDGMIETFNRSRINLNLPNASTDGTAAPPSQPAASRLLNAHPVGRALKRPLRPVAHRVRRLAEARRARTAVAESPAMLLPEQIKGRNFEVPGCGGFLLTGPADDLETYYRDGEEIVCFTDIDDAVDKARHYLAHEDERARVAAAGHARTLAEHTYERRFNDIFGQLGLSAGPLDGIPGETREISA
jgi:spore maturation protein CgeB